jgi:Family of unknown function (DUF6521)
MRQWTQRPREEANLLNPAFCCAALTSSIAGYMAVNVEGIPYPLVFMILPIVLHKATREALPQNTRTSLAAWIQDNAAMRVLFPERVISLKPHTREAVLFGLLHDWLAFQTDARLQTAMGERRINQFRRRLDDKARECVLRANFVGRWFASAGSPQTVLALWGIRP